MTPSGAIDHTAPNSTRSFPFRLLLDCAYCRHTVPPNTAQPPVYCLSAIRPASFTRRSSGPAPLALKHPMLDNTSAAIMSITPSQLCSTHELILMRVQLSQINLKRKKNANIFRPITSPISPHTYSISECLGCFLSRIQS